ncbi:hypothetical protein NDU88_003061 [Pleurodeles waltl]|uniref:Uncharacterized protein n=1 Tax=Pleurodeles waltl TaxID=8319 RepID=A0AAV7QB58_PLEWA|nr:hypothetical protein NDU88_003061 [Pleurodeles waltl]
MKPHAQARRSWDHKRGPPNLEEIATQSGTLGRCLLLPKAQSLNGSPHKVNRAAAGGDPEIAAEQKSEEVRGEGEARMKARMRAKCPSAPSGWNGRSRLLGCILLLRNDRVLEIARIAHSLLSTEAVTN